MSPIETERFSSHDLKLGDLIHSRPLCAWFLILAVDYNLVHSIQLDTYEKKRFPHERYIEGWITIIRDGEQIFPNVK